MLLPGTIVENLGRYVAGAQVRVFTSLMMAGKLGEKLRVDFRKILAKLVFRFLKPTQAEFTQLLNPRKKKLDCIDPITAVAVGNT